MPLGDRWSRERIGKGLPRMGTPKAESRAAEAMRQAREARQRPSPVTGQASAVQAIGAGRAVHGDRPQRVHAQERPGRVTRREITVPAGGGAFEKARSPFARKSSPRRLTEIEVTETSVVDEPANPHALIRLCKAAGIREESAARSAMRKAREERFPGTKAGADEVRVPFARMMAQQIAKRARRADVAGIDSVSVEFEKAQAIDNDQHFFLGWASVAEINGEPVVDHHGDMVSEDELEACSHAFMRGARSGLVQHEGEAALEYTISLPLTAEFKKALGITTESDMTGWIVGGFCHDDATWQRIKSGELPGLSIAGNAVRKARRTSGKYGSIGGRYGR